MYSTSGSSDGERSNRAGRRSSCVLPPALVRENREGTLHGTATDDAQEVASQAAGFERGTAAAHAHAHSGTGSLLALGPARPLPVLRGAYERTCLVLLSPGCGLSVVDGV